MRRAVIFKTSWGWVGISETVKGIDGIVLPKGSKRAVESELGALGSEPFEQGSSDRLESARRQMLKYLAGTSVAFDVPLDLSQGTSFQRRVWRVLQRIPFGKLRSYRWIADQVGGRHYARAVGNAVGANPVPIVIPCHRIVGQDASLGGFSGGLLTKRKLLALEGTLRYVNGS